jgi:hypothetical protein
MPLPISLNLNTFSEFFSYFQLSGLGLIIAGGTVLADVGEFSHFIEGRVFAPPIVLIVAGVLIFLVASLGCYGAFRESPPLLNAVSVSNYQYDHQNFSKHSPPSSPSASWSSSSSNSPLDLPLSPSNLTWKKRSTNRWTHR